VLGEKSVEEVDIGACMACEQSVTLLSQETSERKRICATRKKKQEKAKIQRDRSLAKRRRSERGRDRSFTRSRSRPRNRSVETGDSRHLVMIRRQFVVAHFESVEFMSQRRTTPADNLSSSYGV
jgi:hypothetical protein